VYLALLSHLLFQLLLANCFGLSHINLPKNLHIRAGILMCSSHLHIPNLRN